jgi:hypothetical protein
MMRRKEPELNDSPNLDKRSYKMNKGRYYHESTGMVNLNKRMVDFLGDIDVSGDTYWYIIGQIRINEFKGAKR